MDLPVADASGNDSTYQLFLAEQHSFQKWIALRADTRRSPADAYRACHFVIHRIRYICICNRLHCAATHAHTRRAVQPWSGQAVRLDAPWITPFLISGE